MRKIDIKLFKACDIGSIKRVKVYLKKKIFRKSADVNVNNYRQETPLFHASEGGYREIVEILIENGAAVDIKNICGETPLFRASEKGYKEIVELLIKNGANVDTKDENNRTPLSHATVKGHKAIVELFLEKGADVNNSDYLGETPLSLASKGGHLKIVEMLLAKRAKVDVINRSNETPIFGACLIGKKEIVELLFRKGIKIDEKNDSFKTPLFFACNSGNIELVEFLIENGADLNNSDCWGGTPLFHACWSGCKKIVELLIKNGVEINIRGYNGETPLFTTMFGSIKKYSHYPHDIIVKEQYEEHIDPTITQKDYYEIAEFLIQKGANVNIFDWKERTALDYSIIEGLEDFKKLLYTNNAKRYKDAISLDKSKKITTTVIFVSSGEVSEKTLEKNGKLALQKIEKTVKYNFGFYFADFIKYSIMEDNNVCLEFEVYQGYEEELNKIVTECWYSYFSQYIL